MSFDPFDPRQRFKRFLENVYLKPTAGQVLTMPNQSLVPCQHCGMYHPTKRVWAHEAVCLQNPRRQQQRIIHSQGKAYVAKTEVEPKDIPDPRIASLVWIDGKPYPVLLDDILRIFLRVRKKHPTWLQRKGTYIDHGVSIVQFCVPPMCEKDDPHEASFLDEVNKLISWSRKLGATF